MFEELFLFPHLLCLIRVSMYYPSAALSVPTAVPGGDLSISPRFTPSTYKYMYIYFFSVAMRVQYSS